MQYIGSLYAPDINSDEPRCIAMQQLDRANLTPSGFTVQVILLTAIVVHSEDHLKQARVLLDKAIFLALELRMNSRTFANMERDPVLAESWRRTWWLLYVTDSAFARFRGDPSFFLHTVESNVELPCDDFDTIIPRPKTLTDYESRDFEDDVPVFSSFTYLIDLVRISGYLYSLESELTQDLEGAVKNADHMLLSWRLRLPREKQGVVGSDGEVDEILFQAQSLLQSLQIQIHRPLSHLHASPSEDRPTSVLLSLSREVEDQGNNTWLHARKTLEAAEACIALYALPGRITGHSPLGLGALREASLVGLNAFASGSGLSSNSSLIGREGERDRFRLGLGCLMAFGEVWGLGRRMGMEVKRFSRGVFEARKATSISTSPVAVMGDLDVGFGTGFVLDPAFGSTNEMAEMGIGIGSVGVDMDLQWQQMGVGDVGDVDYFSSWDVTATATGTVGGN